jgi:tungstate transport system ATP-binding protein
MTLLKAIDLEQRAGHTVLLSGVNLEVEKGEVFVIIGPTGAGKTTLLRLLGLLDRPESGQIYLDGADIYASSRPLIEFRRRMSMVLQKPVLFNTTVDENVAYALKVRGTSGSDAKHEVSRALDMVGLEGYQRRRASTLSGGEAQRVALARAMVARPELLLLDEPTANLDPLSVKMIGEIVLKFNRELGVTVVMATHDLTQGQRLANRAGVLMQGQLIESGPPSGIFHLPDDIRVAGFIGIRNIMQGHIVSAEAGIATVEISDRMVSGVSDLPAGTDVDVYIRPDDIVLSKTETHGSARNAAWGRIISIERSGAISNVKVDCGYTMEALITSRSAEEMELSTGQDIFVSFKATAVRLLARNG